MQTLMALAALVMVMVFALNMYRTTANTQQRMAVGEVATQLVGAGSDVLDYLGTREFDANADTSLGPLPISSPSDLTPPGSFGADCSLSYSDGRYSEAGTCEYLENFHGTTFDMAWGSFTFTITIEVCYVDALAPDECLSTQTYAKQASVHITNPNIYLGSLDNPLTITLNRIFTYQKHANPT